MTSFPGRIATAHLALDSLLNQTEAPDRIVLCLSRDEFPGGDDSLPLAMREVLGRGIDVLWCDGNIRAHKKYFHAMRQYPDAAVITVDDDKRYPPTFVAEMKGALQKYPDCVCAMRAHLMTFDQNGAIRPYAEWKNTCEYFVGRRNFALFPVGAGGVLYPPHILNEAVFDMHGIALSAFQNDDIWLKFMGLVNRVPVVVPTAEGDRSVTIEGSQEVSLWATNQAENDKMIARTAEYVRDRFGFDALGFVRENQLAPSADEFRLVIADLIAERSKSVSFWRQLEGMKKEQSQCVREKLSLERSKADADQEVVRQRDQIAQLQMEIGRIAMQRDLLEKSKADADQEVVRQRDQIAMLTDSSQKLREGLTKSIQAVAMQKDRANRASSDYAKMKCWYQRSRSDYQKLSMSKLGRLTLRYWTVKDRLKLHIKRAIKRFGRRPFSGLRVAGKVRPMSVSVIIPTYRKVPWLDDAVKSVIVQKSPTCEVQVLICVNGSDRGYYDALTREFSAVAEVKVLYTPEMGANAGRNIGIRAATKEFVAFLDCDDMLTPGYFKSVLRHFADPSVNIVVGRLVDMDAKSGKRESRTYVNGAMERLGMGEVDASKAAPFLASFCMKVYRSDFLRNQLGEFDVGERHTEDVLFWARRFDRLKGKIFISDPCSSEAYVRRLTENSLSRPKQQDRFQFYIIDRLAILDVLQTILLEESRTCAHRDFVLTRIKAQTSIMERYFDELDGEERRLARQKIQESKNLFLNQALFAEDEAIAFCHNFSPTVDASAFVATKRLREIDQVEGAPLKWRVISQDMSTIRTTDDVFRKYYADFVCVQHVELHEAFGFSPSAQKQFATAAVAEAEKMPVPKVIYSRALFVGSHMAAYQYKKAHPEVNWYAEFSDPHAFGVDNKPRPCSGTPTWFDIEQLVYELADVIIFTNENQLEYMLMYNPRPECNESIRRRARVMRHPVLPHDYCQIVPCEYPLDGTKINIGFFGTFYKTRKCDEMLTLLSNPQVVLHVFTTKPDEMQELVERYAGRLRVSGTISQFEFLNLASRMDYLILTDTDFPGRINPFLPSKYADYLTAGTPVLAKVQPGSILSREQGGLIAVSEFSESFAQGRLRKKPKGNVDHEGVH